MADAGEIKARLTLDMSNFNSNMAKAKNDMDKTSKSSQGLKDDLEKTKTGFKAVGAAAIAGIGYAVYHATMFEHSMARVKALTSATDSQFADLTDTARELGARTEFSASQAAEGMQYLAMAGFDVNEIISAMPNVLNLASAAQVDLGTSADIVSNIMTGFGMSAEETDRAVDVLVDTMRSANTDLNMLADGMKYVAPVAHGLGWSIEETAAAIGAMSDAGVQGSMAGTSLRAALLSLASPTGRAEKAMKKFGINVMDSNGNLKPMPELIGHVNERLSGLTKAQKTAALSHLVGREAAAGFIAMIEKGGPELEKFTNQLKNSQGVAEEVATTQRDTLMGSLKELESAFEELGIIIGNQFLPVLRGLVDWVTELGLLMTKLDPQLMAGALAFTAVGSAAGVAASSLGLLRIGLMGLGPIMGPAGWAILGVSVLAGLFGAAAVSQQKMTETTARQTAEMYKQNQESSEMISRFDDLRTRANMTNDEFAEFLDLHMQLQDKSSLTKAEVQMLSDRMKALQSKSELTNAEWDELVSLNEKLIELYPDHGHQISELGNKYITSVEALRQMNAEEREQLRRNLYTKLDDGLAKYNEKQERAVELKKQYSDADKRIKSIEEERVALKNKLKGIEEELQAAYKSGNIDEIQGILNSRNLLKAKIDSKEKEIEKQRTLRKEIDEEIAGITKAKEALKRNAEQYANILLAENKIKIESGKNLENIHKRIFAIDDELAKYDKRVEKGERLSKLDREQYEAKQKEKGVLESILDQVGAREIFEEEIEKALRKQYEEAKKTKDELNKKTKRKHDHKDVKDEKKTAKASTEELKTKTSRQHNYAGGKKEKETAKDSTKELNKKTKRPHDSSDIKKGLNTAKDTTKEANRKTKKPFDRSDLKKGHGTAKDVTKEANKRARKPFNYSAISNALSDAKSLHKWLTAPARKAVSVARNIYEKVVKRHQGGVVPSFHSGGVADFTHGMGGITPGLGGIDARLLGREMVLTQAQQASLFNAINSGSIGNGGMSRQDLEELADRLASRPIHASIQMDKREVGRAIAEPVKEEHVRMSKQNLRWRGGRKI